MAESMTSSGGPLQTYALRLRPGEELRTSLMRFVNDNDIKSAFILTCCGSVTQATLRFAHDGKQNSIQTLNGYFEIVSMVGTLSGGQGQDQGHLHVSLSDKDGNVIGGHVIGDMIIFTTAEVVIGSCPHVKFVRTLDHQTGFEELQIQKV